MLRRIQPTLWVLAIGATCAAGTLSSCGGDDTTGEAPGGAGNLAGGAGASGSAMQTGAGGSVGGAGAGGTQAGVGGAGTGGAQMDASTPKDGSTDVAAEAGPGIPALCHAIVTSGCQEVGTLDQCTAMLAPFASCAKLMTCATCAGAVPKIACLDGGDIDIVGCETECARISSSCTAGEGGADGATSRDGQTDSGGSTTSTCLGANIVVQANSNNTSQNPQSLGITAAGIAIFGQSLGNGTFGEPGGFFDVSGLFSDTAVNVQIVTSPCAATNCPVDISFNFGQPDGGTVAVSSSPGSCGSAVVRTDGGGHLLVSVSKSGDAGAENGVGIVLRPVVSDASVSGVDASPD